MKNISTSFEKVKSYIKNETNNNPDIIFKNGYFYNYEINIVFSESLTSRDVVNDYILEFFHETQLVRNKKIKNILEYIETRIPTNKVKRIKEEAEMFYMLFSGFTLLFVNGEKECLAIETRAMLSSPINIAQIESVVKGPKDAFTENYQINLGMVRKRLRDKNLWLEELNIGKYSKTKIGILYIQDIASKELVKILKNKIKEIDVDAIYDTNHVIELISEHNKTNVFPNFISTERPDFVSIHLLKGKIAVIIENSPLAIIMPVNFSELFHSAEDYYQKPINASYTRAIRYIAFFITVLVPSIYIAITTYNHEAIPSKLLINFATQRVGVPFPTIMEALLMLITFEILKETDTRLPSMIGSSLSIVGALVLGEAAVTAGIASPIMVIIIALTSISGLIMSYLDVIHGIRWWRILFMLFAAVSGIMGVFIAFILLLIELCSMSSLGVPFMAPLAPFIKNDLGDGAILIRKRKYFKRKTYLTTNLTRGKEKNKK